MILEIDRTTPFDPAEFDAPGYISEEQDERSLALLAIDPNKVSLVNCLKKKERLVGGEENLKRLKNAMPRHILLGAAAFRTLWENQSFIPKYWKGKGDREILYIHFPGTTFRASCYPPRKHRFVFYLCYRNNRWRHGFYSLDNGFRINDLFAVLPILDGHIRANSVAPSLILPKANFYTPAFAT